MSIICKSSWGQVLMWWMRPWLSFRTCHTSLARSRCGILRQQENQVLSSVQQDRGLWLVQRPRSDRLRPGNKQPSYSIDIGLCHSAGQGANEVFFLPDVVNKLIFAWPFNNRLIWATNVISVTVSSTDHDTFATHLSRGVMIARFKIHSYTELW